MLLGEDMLPVCVIRSGSLYDSENSGCSAHWLWLRRADVVQNSDSGCAGNCFIFGLPRDL